MNIVSIDTRDRLLKTFTVFTAIATVLALSGVAYLAPTAFGATPADYGLTEGDTVSAAGSDDPDVYIVNEMGYKRLFLNPAIFGLYGHLGGFAAVKNVSPATRAAFPTSGLFRVDGDEKVYGLESTGEDVANLRWVNTSGAQAVADDPDFFKKVFVINAAEKALYGSGADFTSVNQVPVYVRGGSVPTTPTTPGAVSVSIASGNPAATTITTNAQGVEMLRVRLFGTGTINQMVFKRQGAGAVGDFDNVYVYEGARRLTSGKTFSSATGEVTFINLNVSVSGSKDLSLVGDFSATAGNVDYVALNSMTLASGTVSGLPVSGNNVTISGATSGRLDVAKVGSIPNPNVGTKQALVSEFKLTANTEAALVKRITMLQGGTVKPADTVNWKIKTGSTEWMGSIDSAGYVVFDMSSGHTIAKGGEAIFYVYADVNGKAAEDVNLYFENATDILALGDQYGFGMNTASGTTNQGIDALDAASEAFDVTLQGGVLTIAYNGPSAGNIGTNTADSVLLKFSMTAATNIEVRKTKLVLCKDDNGDGSFVAAADTDSGWSDITDIKVTDEDTGATVLGPADGSAFTVSHAAGTCEDTVTGAERVFTDVIDLAAGKTYNFKVTGDVNTANTDGNGVALVAGDALQIFLDNYTAGGSVSTADVTVMKYSGTNTAVADADIVPQADIGGGIQTLQAASLTLGLSSSVTSQTLVRGTQGKTAVGVAFQAGNASPLTVTDVVLTGYYSDSDTGAGAFTVGCVSTECVSGLVSSVTIYEVESGNVLSTSPSSNQLSNTTGTVTFNSLNWTIPAGATKTLGVKVNLGSNALADTDYISFDINATGDVTALDSSSKTVNAGNSDPNGATPTIKVKVTNAGTMTTAVAPGTPSDHAVYWGQTGDNIGMWRFSAADEGFYLEKLNFQEATAAVQRPLVTNNVKTVYVQYKNKAGSTLTTSSTFNSVASVAFGFTGDNRPYVPKDGSLDVTMLADFKTKAEGARTASQSASFFDIDFIGQSGGGDNTFRAVGEGSGTILNGNDTGVTDRNQTTQIRPYRVYPEFALVAPTATKLSTVDPVLTFTITAKGLSDSNLFFDNLAVGSGSIRFEVVASGVGNNNVAFTVRDGADNSILDTGTITSATVPATAASLAIDFTSKDMEIAGGSSKTIKIYLDAITNFNTPINTTAGVGSDYFQLVLRDENNATNSLVSWVDNSVDANSNDTTWDGTTGFAAGYFRLLPLSGYQFLP